MPEASPAQSTLKRLIEAEEEAREILRAAEEHAQGTLAQARQQAEQSIEGVRREAASLLQYKLEEAESKAATEMKQRLEQAEAEAREIERQGKATFRSGRRHGGGLGNQQERLALSLFSYAAVQGYIRARLSRLWIARHGPAFWKPTPLRNLNQLLAQTGVTLRGEVADTGRALVRFLPRGAGELVAWYNQRFEIENLKTVLRAVHYRLDPSRALASLIPLRATHWSWAGAGGGRIGSRRH